MINSADFQNDYELILKCHYAVLGGENQIDYHEKNARLLSIIDKYENIDSPYGKYAWMTGWAYVSLKLAPYRVGAIKNLEKYLTLLPFEENYADTYIQVNHTDLIKHPETPQEFIQAKKTHFKEIYYLLAKNYEKENMLEKAMFYLKKGMEIIPEEKLTFYWELYEILRKSNNLPLFLNYCDQLSPNEKHKVDALLFQASQRIKHGYVYKPRK